MSHKFIFNSSIFRLLVQIDQDILEEAKQKRCVCGGKLHLAHYSRSPLGIPKEYRSYFEQRFSLCCTLCRKRTAIPTLRFFGRRWYPALLFLFISQLKKGTSASRLQQIKERFGIVIGKHTWKRWRRWWLECFPTTTFWNQKRGQFIGAALLGPHPKVFFKLITGVFEDRLLLLLRFFSPITAGIVRSI